MPSSPIVDPRLEGYQAIRRCHGRDLQGLQVLPSLADVGITAGDLKKLAEDAMKKSGLLINNRREVRYDVVLAVLYGSLRKPGR